MSENKKIPFFNEVVNEQTFKKITEMAFDVMKEVAVKSITDGKSRLDTIKATTDVGVALSKAVLNLAKESGKKL